MRRLFRLFLLLLLLLPALGHAEGRTLSYGAAGGDVTALQERLTELGYYTFRITGNYQENSQKAVRLFQEAHGMQATGVADEALQALIFSEAAMPKPQPTLPPIDMDVAYPGKVEYGSTGDNVRRVQTRLAQLGFYSIEISGQFLGNTRTAVRDFQAQNGLQVDGVVGEQTWQQLFFAGDAVDAAATPRPSPSPSPVPYRVGVDLTNQVTTVYGLDEAGGYTEVVRQMICSTGTASDPTAAGVYELNGKTARWSYFPKWGTHAQYWTRIDAYNAFHSVIYAEPDPMALKTGSYTGLGKPASHGCIRLMVDDAKWLYDNLGKGMEVEVYEGAPDEELTKSLKVPPLDKSVMLPQETPQPTPSPVYDSTALPPMPFTTLEKGTESEAVYWLQCRLAELGYYTGSITGGFYSGTMEAVKAYQRDMGLSADGKAGKQTLNLIYDHVINAPSPTPMILDTAPPTPAATPSPTPTLDPRETVYVPFASPSPEEGEGIPSFYVPRDARGG